MTTPTPSTAYVCNLCRADSKIRLANYRISLKIPVPTDQSASGRTTICWDACRPHLGRSLDLAVQRAADARIHPSITVEPLGGGL